jgi:acetyl-CoA carboxylase biotin carboxyl carrier protein
MANESVRSDITGKVWKLVLAEGAQVSEEDTIMVIESMKMEIPVLAPCAGRLAEVLVKEGDEVAEGQEVARIDLP